MTEGAWLYVTRSFDAWKRLADPGATDVRVPLAFFVVLLALTWVCRGRRSWTLRATFGVLATVTLVHLNFLVMPLLRVLVDALQGAYDGLALPRLPAEAWAHLPGWAVTGVVIVAHDFANYWNHRLMHSPVLWPVHAIHHSEADVHGLTTFRVHALEPFVMFCSHVVLLTWLSLPADALGLAAVALTLHNMYIHADLDWTHGPLERVLASPRFHRWHHADVPEAYGKNLANVFPFFDVAFGTYHSPGPCDVALGAQGLPGDPLRLFLYPAVAWSRQLRGLAGALSRASLRAARAMSALRTTLAGHARTVACLAETAPDVLKRVFGFDAFRPGQEAVVERLLAGRSTLAVFPTGGGKSLCYQLPALLLDGLTLVVSPLIALMKDQVDALLRNGVAAARLDSSLTREETDDVLERMSTGRLKLLYVAPERLSSERFLQRLKRVRIALLAVDEAHCVSEWGHNFRPEYLKVARAAAELGVRAVLALTATATTAVAAEIRRAFEIDPADHVQTDLFRENLALHVTPCPPAVLDRVPLLVERLAATPGPTIVYVTLQRTAEDVAEALRAARVDAQAYHAGLEGEERAAIQDAFMCGATRVVVATIAFGMGIDKSDIRAIYHLNLPKTLESYVQEVGRAGRDGLPARCELFACADDAVVLENFTFGDTPTEEALRALVADVLGQGERFSVASYDLSTRHDIRSLVVDTALTYLELDGTIRATGPFYTGYRLQLLADEQTVLGRFDEGRQRFLRSVLDAGKRGRTWLTLADVASIATTIREPRDRIDAALRYLEEQKLLVLEPSGPRQGYRLERAPGSLDSLVAKLAEQFRKREERDIARCARVLRFVEEPGCLVVHLLDYFGEAARAACGRCTSCVAPGAPRRVARTPHRPLGDAEDRLIASLRAEGHEALRHPRQVTRFLCGLTSPATSKARLGRDPRFGRLGHVPFARVLERVTATL